ncbi:MULTISPECIES: DUF3597 domain-containing protein [unclassified Caballeronia]|uniref:DUF3597 domain-containing protein n=1 Tax=unclassified Caballeronia TaxID=2646786 RepID=UPI00285981B6|nr:MULTISPECIES: DUF3597 domain-containing protein [unclassified Caballeronia]MDR5738696.1 DUF3597 domain-containing protein [Caballeronia sp. LZ016]MDR5811435.1 DUF3597 domain-containing protein [Caballeronia sp. LZ019]
MSIFGDIVGKIFHRAKPEQPAPVVEPDPTPAPVVEATSPQALTDIDVAAVMDQLASESSQTLNWRVSIVDLMKLLQVDSSLDHRKQLATELHYSGDMNDSASMNIWLHKQLMRALAANGGKLPADLIG